MSRPMNPETKVIDGLLARFAERGTGYRRETIGPVIYRMLNPEPEEQKRIIEDHYADLADKRSKVYETVEGVPVFIPDGNGDRHNIYQLRKTPEGRQIALEHAKQRKSAGRTNYRIGVRIEQYIRAAEQGA